MHGVCFRVTGVRACSCLGKSTGVVAGLQNVLFCGSCMISRVCSGIPGSYIG